MPIKFTNFKIYCFFSNFSTVFMFKFCSYIYVLFSFDYRVKEEYYYPTLHQIQVELEDGKTEDGDAIRFDYQEKKFPGYSWKGFVFINEEQVCQHLFFSYHCFGSNHQLKFVSC